MHHSIHNAHTYAYKNRKNKSRKNGMSLLLFTFLQAHMYLTNTYDDEHMPNDKHHFIQLDQDLL